VLLKGWGDRISQCGIVQVELESPLGALSIRRVRSCLPKFARLCDFAPDLNRLLGGAAEDEEKDPRLPDRLDDGQLPNFVTA